MRLWDLAQKPHESSLPTIGRDKRYLGVHGQETMLYLFNCVDNRKIELVFKHEFQEESLGELMPTERIGVYIDYLKGKTNADPQVITKSIYDNNALSLSERIRLIEHGEEDTRSKYDIEIVPWGQHQYGRSPPN